MIGRLEIKDIGNNTDINTVVKPEEEPTGEGSEAAICNSVAEPKEEPKEEQHTGEKRPSGRAKGFKVQPKIVENIVYVDRPVKVKPKKDNLLDERKQKQLSRRESY